MGFGGIVMGVLGLCGGGPPESFNKFKCISCVSASISACSLSSFVLCIWDLLFTHLVPFVAAYVVWWQRRGCVVTVEKLGVLVAGLCHCRKAYPFIIVEIVHVGIIVPKSSPGQSEKNVQV